MGLDKCWQPTPLLLPKESPEEPGGLLSIGLHRVGHNWSDLACMHALEKEMATHSNVLAWRIPGTEEPDGLLFMGWHRVGHYWSNLAAAAASHTEYLPSPKNSFMLPLIISPCPDQFLATTDLFTVCNSFAFPKRLNSWNHIVCNPFKLVSHTL